MPISKQDERFNPVPAVPLPEDLTIGVVQLRVEAGDLEGNIAEARKCIRVAAEQGAQLIVLPETWSHGMAPDAKEYAEPIPGGRIAQFLIGEAKEHRVYICSGTVEKEDDRIYNCAVLIDDNGTVLERYHKVQLYTNLDEHKQYDFGDRLRVIPTKFGRIGILICYDGDYPEAWRTLACQGADIILHPSAYESPCDEWGWWQKIYTTMTMLNGVWCVSANLVARSSNDGGLTENHFFGWSNIINPLGEIVAECEHVLPGGEMRSSVLVQKVNIARGCEEGRNRSNCFLQDLRPELYNLGS